MSSAIAFTVVDGNAFLIILLLGAGLVFLGAQVGGDNAAEPLLTALPRISRKTRLPPYLKDPHGTD